MANEFKHKDVGDELTKAEWEGKDTHEADSQAANDMLYFNGTYWIRATPAQIRTLLNVADGADVTADNDPKAHAASHEDTGADEISIAGLAGEPAELTTHKGLPNVHHTKTTNASELTSGELPTARLAANIKTLSLTFIIDGGGSAITTGQKGHLEIPFACTITRVTALADQSGSIVVDIWKDTYAAFPPTDADSITSATPPTITAAQKSQNSTLTGWTTAIAAGDILAFNVDSCTTITRVTISLKVEKS